MSLEFVKFIVLIIPPILYAGLALWIRPPWKVIGFSFVAGFIMGCLNLLGDVLAYYQEWWHYPFTTANHWMGTLKGWPPISYLPSASISWSSIS